MATIHITDNLDLNADFQIRDDSPLARAGLTKLVSTAKELFQDLEKPVDLVNTKSFALGATFTSPNLIDSDLSNVVASAGVNCTLTVTEPADELLFADDGFSPRIPVQPNQAWVGVELDVSGGLDASASLNGIGASFSSGLKFSYSTYTLFSSAAPPLPSFHEACATAFERFSLATSAAALRSQAPGTVNVAEVQGSVTVGVELQAPFTINALASANLPFNTTASLQPSVTVELAPSVEFTGDLVVRSWKISENQLCFGVYKAHGSTLSVTLTAAAGIEGDVGTTDLLDKILNKALPGVDAAKAGVPSDTAAALNGAIKDGLDRSLSAQINAAFSASLTDEAAVLYQITLDSSSAVDEALGKALHGDWTQLEQMSGDAPNLVRRLRNIAVETTEKKLSFNLNLFGFYSAVSIDDYVKSCTVLADDSGQISIIDKADASRLSAASAPYVADMDKLRKALMEDFVCTAVYAVVAGKLELKVTASQIYFDYERNMSPTAMKENVRLGYALGLIPFASLDDTLRASQAFPHAYVSASLKYQMQDLLQLFFNDVGALTPRTRQELEIQARRTMASLLDPDDNIDSVRLSVLQNDAVWKQMEEIGNVSQFQFIDGLRALNPVLLADVSGDWLTIAWWADAVAKVAPQLKTTLGTLSSASTANPASDAAFMMARQRLSDLLGGFIRSSNSRYVHGWSEAVTFGLTGGNAEASMDLVWSGHRLHYATR